jgi:hypothetical protein
MSMKNSCDTIGNRTRDLPACGAVPQPTAPTPINKKEISQKIKECVRKGKCRKGRERNKD